MNGFRAVAALRRVAADPRVACVEGEGLDPGRVFIHLRPEYWFGPAIRGRSKSVGSAAEIAAAMAKVEPFVSSKQL